MRLLRWSCVTLNGVLPAMTTLRSTSESELRISHVGQPTQVCLVAGRQARKTASRLLLLLLLLLLLGRRRARRLIGRLRRMPLL